MTILLTSTIWSQAQQINPVPDYVFRNQMSVGRNAVTDTAAYFSIGPRYGATKGFMPPIVGDTATFSSGKRNGLLIFSVQKNKFLYWDSVRVQWSDMAGGSGSYILAGDTSAMLAPYLRKVDTTSMLTAYLRKGDTASMLSPYYRSATASAALALKLNISDTSSMLTPYIRHAGYGLTKSGQSFLVDTLNIATRAWRQKGLDSLAALEVSGSGTTNYVPKFTASTTLNNSIIQDNGSGVSINVSPSSAIALYTRALSLTGTGFYSDNGLNTGFIVKYESAPITNIGNDYNQPLGFLTNNTERMRITSTGNVGIGSQSPGGKLTINSSSGDHIQIQRSGGTDRAIVLSGADQLVFGTWTSPTQMALTTSGELLISTTIDGGDYKLQVDGNIYNTGSLTTGAPSGGSIKPWKIGEAATVSPTSPNRTIRVEIDGTVYYLHAKTTND